MFIVTVFTPVSLRYLHIINKIINIPVRALCRTKLLLVTHVLVDKWMLTVKQVYKLKNVSDNLKWTTNTHVTPFIIIIMTSFVPISSKIKLSGATKPRD